MTRVGQRGAVVTAWTGCRRRWPTSREARWGQCGARGGGRAWVSWSKAAIDGKVASRRSGSTSGAVPADDDLDAHEDSHKRKDT
jgi:hypothetical protein